MVKRVFGRAIGLCAALVLAGCGFKAPEPQRTPPPPQQPPPLSTLSATLTIPADRIAALLNQKTAGHVAQIRGQRVKCGVGRCRLTLDAVRTGAIRVAAQHDALLVDLPFAVDAEMSLPGFLSGVHATANARGEAQTATTIALGPSWQIEPTTRGTVQLENSHLRLGPVVTNIRDVWNDNDELLSRPLLKMLDKQIAAGLREQPRIAKLWAHAFKPIKVGKKPVAWLVLEPERLRVGPPLTENGAFVLSLGVDARAHVIVQDAPPQTKPTKLPPPAPLKASRDRFVFTVPALLPYDRAASLALESLSKKPPHIAGMTLRFTKLDILPSGEDVVLATRFCADQSWDVFHWFSACGTGYFRGAPVFDAASGTVRIVRVHYDIATESVILGAVRALAGPALGRELEHALVFNVAKDIAKLERQVAAALAKPQGRDVTISGTVEGFGPPSLTWTKDGFLATFSATGRVSADLRV